MKTPQLLALLLILPLTLSLGFAQDKVKTRGESPTVMVGGEAMYAEKDIVSNALNSKSHSTLVAAVKAAGLVEVLQGDGPFTVFAPVNDAFENLPEGTVDNLLKPENKETLAKILTYHVVPGNLDMKELARLVRAGDGKATLTTAAGSKLYVKMNGPSNLILEDEKGNIANFTTYDVTQSNGVIHVIDAVVLPN